MVRTYTRNRVHIVFSTKEHRDLILSESKMREVFETAGRKDRIEVLAVGGTANHIHVLVDIPGHLPVSRVVQNLKASTSHVMKETTPDFAWQEGFAAFSVSLSNSDAVAQYIHEQATHHAKHTFEDEYRSLLVRHGIAFDEKYVFS